MLPISFKSLFSNQTKKANFKAIVLISKATRNRKYSLGVVIFCLVGQSNYLNNSSKDCDWFIQCSVLYQRTDALFGHFSSFGKQSLEEYSVQCVGKYHYILFHEANI